MPYIASSSYPGPPWWQFNGHIQTVGPALLGAPPVAYTRERLEMDDGDFLDLDWLLADHDTLVIISHGLEGSSERYYVARAARFFASKQCDVLAWNCRSCSGEMNRNFRLYHHGEIEDLGTVVQYALQQRAYARMVLIGYSMGGAMVLKYLGAKAKELPAQVAGGVVFSAPCNLAASAAALEQPSNFIYKNRFLRSLSQKVTDLDRRYPGRIDVSKLDQVKKWSDFDSWFSAPISGYTDLTAFYDQASAENFMPHIELPVFLANAQNDPILPAACTPIALCEQHPHIYLEYPRTGGHVGFAVAGQEFTWMETRAWAFINELGMA